MGGKFEVSAGKDITCRLVGLIRDIALASRLALPVGRQVIRDPVLATDEVVSCSAATVPAAVQRDTVLAGQESCALMNTTVCHIAVRLYDFFSTEFSLL